MLTKVNVMAQHALTVNNPLLVDVGKVPPRTHAQSRGTGSMEEMEKRLFSNSCHCVQTEKGKGFKKIFEI